MDAPTRTLSLSAYHGRFRSLAVQQSVIALSLVSDFEPDAQRSAEGRCGG